MQYASSCYFRHRHPALKNRIENLQEETDLMRTESGTGTVVAAAAAASLVLSPPAAEAALVPLTGRTLHTRVGMA